MRNQTMTLVQAAARLGLSYNPTFRLVLLGKLPGHQDERGRWHVDASAVERMAEEMNTPSAA